MLAAIRAAANLFAQIMGSRFSIMQPLHAKPPDPRPGETIRAPAPYGKIGNNRPERPAAAPSMIGDHL